MSSEPVLPVIDLRLSSGATRPALVEKLLHALEDTGFFYLEGVEGYDQKELEHWTRWFFSQTLEERYRLATKTFRKENTNKYRGYFPVQKGETSNKEGYEMGPQYDPDDPVLKMNYVFAEHTPWMHIESDLENCRKFKTCMQRNYEIHNKAGLEIQRMIAEGVGAEGDWFDRLYHPTHLSTFRLLHYPPREDNPVVGACDGELALQCSEHCDSGMLTLLTTFHFKGLQVKLDDGHWLDVPPRPGALIVNLGDILSIMSGGRFKATVHRVIDLGEHRYSASFFSEPRYDADISEKLPASGPEKEKDIQPKQYGPWLVQKMLQYAEFRDLCKEMMIK